MWFSCQLGEIALLFYVGIFFVAIVAAATFSVQFSFQVAPRLRSSARNKSSLGAKNRKNYIICTVIHVPRLPIMGIALYFPGEFIPLIGNSA